MEASAVIDVIRTEGQTRFRGRRCRLDGPASRLRTGYDAFVPSAADVVPVVAGSGGFDHRDVGV